MGKIQVSEDLWWLKIKNADSNNVRAFIFIILKCLQNNIIRCSSQHCSGLLKSYFGWIKVLLILVGMSSYSSIAVCKSLYSDSVDQGMEASVLHWRLQSPRDPHGTGLCLVSVQPS